MNCSLLSTQPVTYQQQSEWCWAAVTASVDEYYNGGSGQKQCKIVEGHFPGKSCCIKGSSKACNKTFQLEIALSGIGHMSGAVLNRSLTYSESERQNCTLKRPFGVRIQWHGTPGGHFVTITGVHDDKRTELHIEDPDWGRLVMAHKTIQTAYQSSYHSGKPQGSWTDSYPTS